MKRAVCALLPLLLCACEPATLPAPSILSVTPEQVTLGAQSALTVQVSAVLPLTVDYQERYVDPAQLGMTLRLAGQEVDIPFANREGTLIVPVPQDLELGTYDIQLTLADGRAAVREQAFSVVRAPLFTGGTHRGDGGVGEDGGSGGLVVDGITGFQFDRIGEQVRDRPFLVTIHAQGPDASFFGGPVSLHASKGRLTAFTRRSFVDGVSEEEISLSQPSMGMYLLVEDSQGHWGLSNPFRVRPY